MKGQGLRSVEEMKAPVIFSHTAWLYWGTERGREKIAELWNMMVVNTGRQDECLRLANWIEGVSNLL